ncbi:alkaline phosphatase [Microcoleus sp. FACHB-1515]|uniref:alkaline phosphatase n=1 Tax=Cyanophyceae TaxID=3028117 RepID=UPI00168339D1|nr:alkaline phosphatase [Microcoleus sp. FACHB-1515]MBD2091667.1 alkaline phosphatase [Microcoleus sp. FACHB-1515]
MTGNHVIFIHPDGTSPATFAFARFVAQGPDGRLNWDNLDEARVYLGHMEDQLTGTSNAGAVTHATGVKAYAESFGLEVVRDANGNPTVGANGRALETPLTALSGKQQTIVEEAVAANKATALINSGAIAEPGTGAFVAQVGQTDVPPGLSGFENFPRSQFAKITEQVVRSGVDVILGGGLVNYLPVGTQPPAGATYATSAAQLDAISRSASQRPNINLIELAQSLGYTIVYTEEQLNAVVADGRTTKVLGIFANEDTFNDNVRTGTGNLSGVEENLIATGNAPYVPSAPTVGEMLAAAQTLMERNPKFQNGSLTVLEEEGTDNFGNINNAAGMLEALRRTDGAIGQALAFHDRHPNTLIITAADSEAGGLQVRDPLPAGNVGTVPANPTNIPGQPSGAFNNPLDGRSGSRTEPFTSAPDAQGNSFNFGVGWVGTPDFAGNIVTKAHGLNADTLPVTVDNTDIYRAMYLTLFGVDLPARVADAPEAPAATSTTGNVIFFHPDGHSPAMFGAARFVSEGPDGRLNWDRMSNTGVYLGHLTDQLTGASDGSGVVHANGVKVFQDSYGLNEDGSRVTPFSGKVGSTILEEARDRGKAVVMINSGRISEPGSGAFAAEVSSRGDNNEIVRQHIMESGAQVIMGGGERWMLPEGVAGRFGVGARTDGLNLIAEAQQLGYRVIFTREELATIQPGEKILGVFAWEDTYNTATEENLQARGLQPYGQPGNPNPPTVAEMMEGALRSVRNAPNGFFIASEEEGTDNFPNSNNAAATIQATLRADAAIGVAQNFVNTVDPNTMILTAADSEAGGLQVWQPTPFAPGFPTTPLPTTPTIPVNPTNVGTNQNPLDGQNGRLAPWTAFQSQPSLDGAMGGFGIGWVGTPDFPGNIVAKSYGLNADRLPSTLDNTEIYKQMYFSLFGELGDSSAIDGTSGNDTLFGNSSDEAFIGGGGNDIVYAGEGNNRVYIGVGNSTVYVGAGNDVVSTDDGNQTIYAGEGNNRLSVGRGNSTLYAGAGNDIISLLGGNNTVYAGEGRNVITVGAGTDTNAAGDDRIFTGAGNDYINASGGNNTIYAGEGANNIVTGAGDDLIDVGAGDDFIRAGAGNNTIYAGEGNNTIASSGNDLIYIGSGRDRLQLGRGTGNATVITFNSAIDRIALGGGLQFSDLSIAQNGGDTTISAGSDRLATLKSVQASSITSSVFA